MVRCRADLQLERDRGQYADPQRDRNRPRKRHHDRRQAAQGSSRGAGPPRCRCTLFARSPLRASRCAKSTYRRDPPARPNAGVDPEEAGRYSRHQRMIAGSPLVLPVAGRNSGLDGRFRRLACDRAARTRDRIRGTRSARRDPSVQRWQWPNRAALDEPAADPGRLSAGRHRSGAARRPISTRCKPCSCARPAKPYQRFMTERLEASLDHHLAMLERLTPPCAG